MRTLSGWVIAVWIIAFALLILDVAVSTYNIEALIANDREVGHSRDISRAVANLISAVKDAETGQRGYQITGQKQYLEPFLEAEQTVPERLDRLRELTAGDPFYDARIDRLSALVGDKFGELRRTIEIRNGPNGENAAREEIARGHGKELMDHIRLLSRELDRHEDGALVEKSSAATQKYRSSSFMALFGGILTVLMVAMAFAMVRRELVHRERAEAQVRRAAADLVRSQAETSESLALLDAFFENAPIGIAFFDPDLRYRRINEHLASANGTSIADHIGRPLLDAVPAMPAAIVADLRQVAETRRPLLNREATGRPGRPDRMWLSSYFPVHTTNGRPLGIGVVAQDITDRLAAVQRLRDSEARKTAILETALDCVITIDHEGTVVEFNPAAEQTFGYSRAEIVGQLMPERIVPPSYRDGHARGLARYLATGEGPVLNRRIELPALRKDGTEFPVELAITAITQGDRPVFTAYLRDITERKRAEDTLRASEARFRTLTDAIPQLVWNTNAAGEVTYFNRRWVEYTGLTATAAFESWWPQVAHPDDASRMDAGWRQAVTEHRESFEMEVRIRDAEDGSYHWFLTALVALRRADGTVDQWIGSLTPIDEQKRQSEILAALVRMRTTELESANQLLRKEIAERTRAEGRAQATAVELGRSNEELEQFAYVASHDLQEPLRKIQAFGDRLAKKYRDLLGADGVEYLDRMKASAARMRTLIDDLLTFSRVATKGRPSAPVDLGTIVADVLSDLEFRLTQSGGKVDLGDLPTLEADPLQMRQLFQNLIGNSLKFQKPNVAPEVTVRAVPWSSLPPDADPLPRSGNGYRITVADNGIGFDQAYAERIFEVFQRLHGRGEFEGTGIGLAICRKIVQRHGGEIVARSRAGHGTTFILDLPSAAS